MAVSVLQPATHLFAETLNDKLDIAASRSSVEFRNTAPPPPSLPPFSHGVTEEVPFVCVHHAFAYHAQRAPDALAAITHGGEGERITYGRLDALSTRVARMFQASGMKEGERVVILTQRSIPMLVAIMATLKAGAAYVPLDGGIVTDSSLSHVTANSGSHIIAVGKEWAHRVDLLNEQLATQGNPTVHKFVLEDIIVEASQDLDENRVHEEVQRNEFRNSGKGDNGCYVIYTSGTTGKPKGVDVMHSNVTNLVCLSPGNIGMRPGLRVSQLLNVAFDMAAWEILGALSNGCTLVIRGKTSKDWKTALKNVDIVIATPSILGPHDPEDYPNIKSVATAGEVCPQTLADRWSKYATFHNSCGPTEITIVNTVEAHVEGAPLSIGKPTPNNSVYILDAETMLPVSIGQPGIMWAGGKGITRGYVGLEALTQQKYRPDPWRVGEMMFNTGDIGKWREDGMIDHLGRADDQVKVKGFRVELDGVSAAMETCPSVKVAVALLIGTELWGFYTPATVETEAVKAAASRVQPYYAVPTHFVAMDTFAQTSNGKTDKRALRAIAEKRAVAEPARGASVAEKKAVAEPARVTSAAQKPLQDLNGRFKSQDFVFTPYRVSHHVSRAVSNWMVTDADHHAPAPLWTTLVQEAATPPPSYQQNFTPYLPGAFFSHRVFSASDNRSFISQLSKAPSFESNNTKVNEELSSQVYPNPEIAEKGEADVALSWEGYLDEELPPQTLGNTLSRLRHSIFTLYRRLFGVVFVTNVAIFIATLIKGHANALYLGQIVIANFFVAILMRQDYVVNAFFNVFCAVPSSWPLAIRRVCARVYHIGGLHSGAAISAIVWLILFAVQATIEMTQGKVSVATVVMTYLIVMLLLMMVIFAYPRFRSVAHNNFEKSHRFMGWTATALVWVQVILLINDYKAPGQPLGDALKAAVPFWLVVIMTASIILPWTRLRRVPVRSEVLSSHAVRLYFDYVTPIAGSYTRISESPLLEWHSFATVPEPGKTGYSLVVSKAGDWTTKQIEHPPTHLWVRGVPTFGVLRIVPLFRRLVFVATGSGIGPCAPCILEQKVPIRLLWTSPNVRQTFGDKLVDSLLEVSPGAVVYDTRKHGKPDMVKLTMKLVREFRAEAVCVISNQKLTEQVVYGMMSRGIPAFGAIWDS